MKNRILIIDDEQISTHIISNKLSKHGFQVTVENDVTNVKIESIMNSYDLILLDIVMPKMTGIDFLKLARTIYSPNVLPIVMLTAQNTSEDIVTSLNIGANDYITKPVDIDVAISRINIHLRLLKLNENSEKAKQLEAINSMIATYNHEINNPLAIAYVKIHKLEKESKTKMPLLDDVKTALDRIRDIVKKIKSTAENTELEFEKYSESSKMIKVK